MWGQVSDDDEARGGKKEGPRNALRTIQKARNKCGERWGGGASFLSCVCYVVKTIAHSIENNL